MIRRLVSAALLLRDGYTGMTFPSGADIFCTLDGQPVSPVWKKEGYLVFTDLSHGPHTLLINKHGFQQETVTLETGEKIVEDTILLRPDENYPFRDEPVRLQLSLVSKTPIQTVWIGQKGGPLLKLAQDKTEKAERTVRLFCKGNADALPLPGWFLIADEKKAELVHVESFDGENGQLTEPMTVPHARGKELIAMNHYYIDESGCIELLFRQAGTASLFCQGAWKQITLQSGTQSVVWDLGKE